MVFTLHSYIKHNATTVFRRLWKYGGTFGEYCGGFFNILPYGLFWRLFLLLLPPLFSKSLLNALVRKLDRDFGDRFSFLLSIPAILGAVVLSFKDFLKGGPVEAGGIGTAAVIAGTVSAAVVGFFAVRLMLKIIREKSLFGFAVYTAVLGVLVLADQAGTHFF